jgi:hypothetical protein
MLLYQWSSRYGRAVEKAVWNTLLQKKNGYFGR